jgi:hypothetical protein
MSATKSPEEQGRGEPAEDLQNAQTTKSLDEEGHGQNVEDLHNEQTRATYINTRTGLSPEHEQYLIQRHGTVDLDPVPGPGGADPYNWPNWKVCETIVFLQSAH